MTAKRPVIGLLGGMGWPSTGRYYETLNAQAAARGATVHALINSLAFDDVLEIVTRDGFRSAGHMIGREARRLQDAGTDCVALCAVTAHLMHHQVVEAVSVPVPHIGGAIAQHVEGHRSARFGLLGTKPALTGHALGLGDGMIVPSEDRLQALDEAIRSDIAFGRIGSEQVAVVNAALDDVIAQGADRIVLACTELPLLADRLETDLPMVDAVALHCAVLLDMMDRV